MFQSHSGRSHCLYDYVDPDVLPAGSVAVAAKVSDLDRPGFR